MPASVGAAREGITGRHQTSPIAIGNGRAAVAQKRPNRDQVLYGLGRQSNDHLGAGSSPGLPQNNSHARTLSYGTVRPASADATPFSTAARAPDHPSPQAPRQRAVG